MKKNISIFSLLITMSLVIACAPKDEGTTFKTELIQVENLKNYPQKDSQESDLITSLQTDVRALNQHATITMVLMPKGDLQKSIESLKTAGGVLVYDPNNGLGSSIPFYIAELTPELVNNTAFMSSLKLKTASVDRVAAKVAPVDSGISSINLDLTQFIPTDSVDIDSLGDKRELGKNITVAVIDTGIDASHPAFGDRVVYWYDATQETRTELKEVTLVNNGTTVSIDGKDKKIILPKEVIGEETFIAVMSEGKFIAQIATEERYGRAFLDLNSNNSKDDFLVVVSKKDGKTKIFFDANADLKLAASSELIAKINYNETTKSNRLEGMVEFPSRNNILKYPLLLEEENGKMFINLGKTQGSHGTHVAGIIAADDQSNNLLGAAPKADLMSLKVCSGISCTDSAIIKGLYKAFYNGKVIPDVVNISLGSHESYKRDLYSYVMNDLSAKFGTVFFISASNSGPGFRSLNHFGNSGAVVMVGANVSKKTLSEQYNLPSGAITQDENLLFFSSFGPSYTGEMKPNIIAPGAAISAIPAAGGYMSQMNGTSMSSPIAAGTFAAVLGKVKEENGTLFNNINKMRKYHSAGSTKAKISLLPYVYAMRDSLQNAAVSQPNLTLAQQGYGLIQAGATASLLKTYLGELNTGDRDYFEVVINGDKKAYDRKSLITKKLQAFKLTIGVDGERTKESLASLIASGVDVELARVEILASNGEVEVVTSNMDKYFSIVEQGDDTNALLNTHVTFNNGRTPQFFSRRNIANMETGKTYIAHYKINRKNVNITNIIDVVHRAITLSEVELNLPALNLDKTKTKMGFAKATVAIENNVFHRYQVNIDKSINHISVQVGINNGSRGRLYVQLYNPDGKEVDFVVAKANSIESNSIAKIKVPTAKNGKIQAGVWEVTISSSSSTWLSSSSYDLMIEGLLFGTKTKSFKINLGNELIIPAQLGGSKISMLKVLNLRQVIKNKVLVKSGYVSFQKLILPVNYSGKASLNVLPNNDLYWGDVSPFLYIKENGDFKVLDSGYTFSKNTFEINAPLSQEVYFALDTITNYSGEASSAKSVIVESVIQTSTNLDIETSFDNVLNMDMAIIKVMAKSFELNSLGFQHSYLRAELMLVAGDYKEVIDVSGNSILQIADDAIINRVELTIKK
jgi:subtilisin family serine protease